jgi:hypothetical protein
MKRALIHTATKKVVQVVSQGGEFPVHPDYAWLDCPDECMAYTWGYDGVAFSPPAPPPLASIKAAKRKAINAARDAEESAGFDYLGKRFDSDLQGIKRLYGAIMAALVAPGNFDVQWTTSDGSTITLNKGQLTALPLVMAAASNSLHAKARNLKAQINAAQSASEVDAVVW